jgi:hypothetical protein
MENLYVIVNKMEKGSPLNLSEGILHTELKKDKPFEPLITDSGEWRKYKNNITQLPSELWFITKDKYYNFDMRWDSGGFFISNEMLNLLKRHNTIDYVYTKLNILNKKLEPVSSKEYYYMKFNNYSDIIDYEKSKIDYDKKGIVKKIWRLSIKGINENVFMINNWSLYNKLFCDEMFKNEAEKNKIIGIEFAPLKDAGII